MIPWFIDLTLSFFLFVLSSVIYIQAGKFPEISAAFPRVMAIFLFVVTIPLTIRAIRRRKEEIEKSDIDYKTVSAIVLGMIIYTIVLKWLGYVIPTIMLIGYIIYVMGYSNKKNIGFISCCAIIVIYFIFKIALKVPLPIGFLNFI